MSQVGSPPTDQNEHGLPVFLDAMTGERRVLGFRSSPGGKLRLRSLPRYADVNGLIDPKDYSAFDEWPSQVEIKDQNGKGACNGHAKALCMEVDRVYRGMKHIPLSAWFAYGRMVRGRDIGSNIGEALALVEREGIAPESVVKYGDYSGRYSASVHAEALKFRCERGSMLTTEAEIITAILRREPLDLSVTVGMGFNNLDDEGVPPLGWGMNNHAVFVGLGLKWSDRRRCWLGKMANSWTKKWGWNGFCWLPIKTLVTYTGSFECSHVISVIDRSDDPTRPPNL